MKLSYLLSSIFVICIAAHTAHSSDLTPAQCLWCLNVLIIEATTPAGQETAAKLQVQDEMTASQQSKKKALKYPKTPKCIKRPKTKKRH